MKLIFLFSLALGLVSCSKQESISPVAKSLQDGLVAYYPLNGSLLDVSGNQRHAKLDKAVFSVDHLGKSKASLVFSSVQPTAAEVPSGLLKQTSTICFWAKKSDTKVPLFIWDNQFERQERVSGITTTSTYGFRLGTEGTGSFYTIQLKLGVLSFFQMNIPYMPNIWEFYVIQFAEIKGITTSGEVTVYKNGVRFMQQTVGAVFMNALESSGVNRMGGGFPKGLNAEGQIDELGIWSRSLTEAEILQLYKHGF